MANPAIARPTIRAVDGPDEKTLSESSYRRLRAGSSWATLGRVLSAISSVALFTMLARILSPAELGAYFLTFSIVTTLAAMSLFGLHRAVVPLVAAANGHGNSRRARGLVLRVLLYGSSSALLVGVLFGSGVGSWIAANVFESSPTATLCGLGAIWLVALAILNLLSESFRSFHDIRLATLFGGVLTSSLSAIAVALLHWTDHALSLTLVVTIAVIISASSAVVGSFLLWMKLRPLPPGGRVQFREVAVVSLPLYVNSLLYLTMTQVDLWILSVYRSDQEIALWGAITRLLVLVGMPLLIVNAALAPMIAELNAKSRFRELECLLRSSSTAAAIPAVLMLVTFLVFHASILRHALGEFYVLGGPALMILACGQLFSVCTGSCGLTLMMTGKQSSLMKAMFSCGIVTILLSLVLVGPLGVFGVAIGAATGQVLRNFVVWLLVKRHVGVWTHIGSPQLLMQLFRRSPAKSRQACA